MARQRAFTEEELNELCHKAIKGDEESMQILKDEYEGMIKRIGFSKAYTVDEIKLQFLKKVGYSPSVSQLKVCTTLLGVTEYKIYHYKYKDVMFERDFATKRIIRKVKDIQKVSSAETGARKVKKVKKVRKAGKLEAIKRRGRIYEIIRDSKGRFIKWVRRFG